METGEGKIDPGVRIELTEQQKRARRRRNIAIGLALFGMVIAFYAASLAKFGPALLNTIQSSSEVKQ